MASELIKAVRRLSNLESAWQSVQANGRTSKSNDVKLDLEKFALDAQRNLRSIKGRLSQGSFKFDKAKGVPIPKTDDKGKSTGKIRPIVLAPVESRIVQRAILNVLIEVEGLKPYFKTPFSFGGVRSERIIGGRTVPREASLSAVPAAIKAVLTEIGSGAQYVACADIRAFFTRVPKDHVISIISAAVGDPELSALCRSAIEVELSNMAQLREHASEFPIEDIGVAQGNSLSSLLGNIFLADFDAQMNDGDCKCIRYIDDFIILAPTKAAADARLKRAKGILGKLGMELSDEKTSKGGIDIKDGFDFLGINICPGAIRPGKKAQVKVQTSVKEAFDGSLKSLRAFVNGQPYDSTQSLSATLKRVDGTLNGWSKHYWFCNDKQIFRNIDNKVGELVQNYLGAYAAIKSTAKPTLHQKLLGVTEVADVDRQPFDYPSLAHR